MSQTKASDYPGGEGLHSGLILPRLPDGLVYLNKVQERLFITWRVDTMKLRLMLVTFLDFILQMDFSQYLQFIYEAAHCYHHHMTVGP